MSRRIVEGTRGRFGSAEASRAPLRATTDPRVYEAWMWVMHEGRTFVQESVYSGILHCGGSRGALR